MYFLWGQEFFIRVFLVDSFRRVPSPYTTEHIDRLINMKITMRLTFYQELNVLILEVIFSLVTLDTMYYMIYKLCVFSILYF